MSLYSLAYRFIRTMDTETMHRAAIKAISSGLVPACGVREYPELATEVMGLQFPNPVGLAAGFDKNAQTLGRIHRYGFGFAEVGTVTPRPQEGNPQPRLFRLEEDGAVINRMGFNNAGVEALCANVERTGSRGVFGINIGKNKDSEDAVADYLTLLERVYALPDYITVNISSPNTPGLRGLQAREPLLALLGALREKRDALAEEHDGHTVPLAVKIAPDVTDAELEDMCAVALEQGVDGLIISNTTIARPEWLHSANKVETGGLSGRPLFASSTVVLRKAYVLTEGKIPLIGVGGVSSAEEAYVKIRSGASLVQLYSALVYEGLGLVERIKKGLAENLRRDGFARISQAVGVDA